MILGTKILLDLVKKQNLVKGLSERELTNPEGAVFDLRIGEVYRLKSASFLGIEERQTSDLELMAKYDPSKRSSIVIKPGEYFLIKTIEEVNVPENLVGLFWPRSTLFRGGLSLQAGVANPGYSGGLSMGLSNLGNQDYEIEMGARVVSVIFFEVAGEVVSKYRGQWQGGRTHAKIREKQV